MKVYDVEKRQGIVRLDVNPKSVKVVVKELVASGVYFYTLTAGEFTATRKMLITK